MDFKIHTFLLLHFVLVYFPVLSLIVSNQCPSYICKPSTMIFTDITCLYYDKEAYFYYAKECPSNKLCQYTGTSPNKTCTEEALSFGESWVGEKCKTNTDCYNQFSSGCVDGKCEGIPMGQMCTSFYKCLPGNSCINGRCTPQIEIGQKGCSSDYDCVNNGACDIKSATNPQANTCYQVFSYEPYQQVGSCVNQQSMLCKYLTCAQNTTGNYYCTNMLVSDPAPASLCDQEVSRCFSKPDNEFDPPYVASQYCACAYNSVGNAYCNLFLGDGPGLNYLNMRAKWYSSSEIFKCNTGRREEFNCMRDYWDSKNFYAYYYWYKYYYDYNYIVGSDECVIKTAGSSYSYAKKLYENGGGSGGDGDSDESSSTILGISLLIGFIIY